MTRKRNCELRGAEQTATPKVLPLLCEGAEYMLELSASEVVVPAVLRRIVDNMPLGLGFSFQLPDRLIFVYERDVRPGPKGYLIVIAG